jgi:hypothetical protein
MEDLEERHCFFCFGRELIRVRKRKCTGFDLESYYSWGSSVCIRHEWLCNVCLRVCIENICQEENTMEYIMKMWKAKFRTFYERDWDEEYDTFCFCIDAVVYSLFVHTTQHNCTHTMQYNAIQCNATQGQKYKLALKFTDNRTTKKTKKQFISLWMSDSTVEKVQKKKE